MTGETSDTTEDDVDDLDSDLSSDDEILSDDDDDAIVMTAEINVEKLVAKIDKQDGNEVERKKAVKRRLEEIEEHKKEMKELDSTYNFNLDDEL